ncbi:Hypothetical protein POVN_LOCUS232 [uncultured virus]|nr:Hypothetical protein POVN_LOCUS232 [uncultured virus]
MGENSLSSLTTPTGTLHIYRAADGFYGVRPGVGATKLVIEGPYNGTYPIGNTAPTSIAALQFRVDGVRFTPGGQIAILYSWLNLVVYPAIRASRITLLPVPASFTEPLRFQITWPGMTPNTNITAGSAQQLRGDFYNYGTTIGFRGPISSIAWFDIDDRFPLVRLLAIDAEGILYIALTTNELINQVLIGGKTVDFTRSGLTGVRWAQFYSFGKVLQEPTAFYYIAGDRSQVLISTPPGEAVPAIRLPPLSAPGGTVGGSSLYSVMGGGVAKTDILYLTNQNNRYELRLRNSFDMVLPGYFGASTQVSASQKSQALGMVSTAPTEYYLLNATL